MTLLEKFYEWWDKADFEEIIIMALMAAVTALAVFVLIVFIIAVAVGGLQ